MKDHEDAEQPFEEDADVEEVARAIAYGKGRRMELFRALPLPKRSAVFNMLSPHVRQETLKRLATDEVVELLDHLDLRRTHRVLAGMRNNGRRERIITRLKNDRYLKIEQFLRFHSRASLSLIHINYVLLQGETTVVETANVIEDHLHTTGKIPVVLVHEDGHLTGEVSAGTLVRERNTSKLQGHVRPIAAIAYNAPQHDIVGLFTTTPHKKAAVLDTDGSVLGIVYSDDILDLLGESPAASLYSFAGVEESERPFDSTWSKVRHRYRWLILNLGTAFLAAGVVFLFEDTLTQVVLLAMYMPVIAGMGGNAATQTLAVMVRGIAIGEISLKNSAPAIWREVLAGLVNGALTGTIVTVAALLFNGEPLLGLVAGIAVMFALVIAGFFGAFIPLLLRSFGKDPATSATIFITTATDMLGFFVLLGLAALLLI